MGRVRQAQTAAELEIARMLRAQGAAYRKKVKGLAGSREVWAAAPTSGGV